MKDHSHVDLLFVDDDEELLSTMVQRFSQLGFSMHKAGSGAEALRLFEQREFDVAVVDMMMPGMTGLELLEKLRAAGNDCEVLLLTGEGTIERAVAAMKLGAYDFLTKPVQTKELEALVEKAYAHRQLAKENRQLKSLLDRGRATPEMIGESPAMKEVFRLIERAGPSDKAILIQGESGTGKELVARALHRFSPRAKKPLVVINCAALPETLLESELFGFEKGSFTGATSAKDGLFEVADGGTLFIDEMGEMPGSLQAKLLRVLEDGSLRRIGSIKERKVNVRLIAATNRNLQAEVKAGRFREDLFYRINVMSLELPPLRRRDGDVPLLVDHFLGPDWDIDDEALKVMETYSWPGNVRQLINALERAKIMGDGHVIHVRDLPPDVREGLAPRSQMAPAISDIDELKAIERTKVVEILQRVRGNKMHAARTLGIERRKIYRLIEKYNITEADWK